MRRTRDTTVLKSWLLGMLRLVRISIGICRYASLKMPQNNDLNEARKHRPKSVWMVPVKHIEDCFSPAMKSISAGWRPSSEGGGSMRASAMIAGA